MRLRNNKSFFQEALFYSLRIDNAFLWGWAMCPPFLMRILNEEVYLIELDKKLYE